MRGLILILSLAVRSTPTRRRHLFEQRPQTLKHFVFFFSLHEARLIAESLFADVISRMDERGHVIV